MVCKRNNNKTFKSGRLIRLVLVFGLQLTVQHLFSQTKQAVIQLAFSQTDSTKTCRATVKSDTALVRKTEVHLYVKRMYGLLAIGKVAETDDNGLAEFNFPMDLPGDKNDMLTIVAKVEKDETYGTAVTEAAVKWGAKPKGEASQWSNRSLSASREKAPMFLVVASSLIILIIWGTIFYVVFQLFKIKRSQVAGKSAVPAQ